MNHIDRPEPCGAARARHAYVTLVTNNDYLKGAVALVRSIRLSGSTADIVVLHTGAVSRDELCQLMAMDVRIAQVRLLETSDAFNLRHGRARIHADAPFTKGCKPDFHTPLDNFCKLRLWQLTEYERCVFIDADALVLRNIDSLFEEPELSAAPNLYSSMDDLGRINSGVFVARPNATTFSEMIARLDAPGAFWRRTDQTFLETFFSDWKRLSYRLNTLQYVWINLPELWDWSAIRVLHFQYEKPWDAAHPKSDVLEPLIELWRAYFHGDRVPDLNRLPHPNVVA